MATIFEKKWETRNIGFVSSQFKKLKNCLPFPKTGSRFWTNAFAGLKLHVILEPMGHWGETSSKTLERSLPANVFAGTKGFLGRKMKGISNGTLEIVT